MASLWDDAVDPYTGMSIQPPEQNAAEPSLWDHLKNFFTPGQASAGDPRAAVTMPPEVGSYLHDVITGRKAMQGLEALQPATPYTPGQSLASMALDPASQEQAQNVALSLGLGNIRAYHGSPHDFSAFDTAKIGTGEGAQAYGHGMYFAENEGVARGYRDALGPLGAMDTLDNFLTKNRGINLRPDEIVTKLKGTRAEALADDPQSIEALRKLLPNYLPNKAVSGEDLVHYRYLDSAAERLIPGKMYEVNLNAEPEDFLQWDKPLSEQGKSVQKALEPYRDLLTLRDPSTGLPAPEYGEPTGADVYRKISDKLGIPQGPNDLGGWRVGGPAASERLKEIGIPGIRYLDQGSRGAGAGTHNYVVFDPKTIDIRRKYLIPGLLGGAAAGAAATDGGS